MKLSTFLLLTILACTASASSRYDEEPQAAPAAVEKKAEIIEIQAPQLIAAAPAAQLIAAPDVQIQAAPAAQIQSAPAADASLQLIAAPAAAPEPIALGNMDVPQLLGSLQSFTGNLEAAPLQAAPAQAAPVQAAPAQAAPAQAAPIQDDSSKNAPIQTVTVEDIPFQPAVLQIAPAQAAPADQLVVLDAPDVAFSAAPIAQPVAISAPVLISAAPAAQAVAAPIAAAPAAQAIPADAALFATKYNVGIFQNNAAAQAFPAAAAPAAAAPAAAAPAANFNILSAQAPQQNFAQAAPLQAAPIQAAPAAAFNPQFAVYNMGINQAKMPVFPSYPSAFANQAAPAAASFPAAAAPAANFAAPAANYAAPAANYAAPASQAAPAQASQAALYAQKYNVGIFDAKGANNQFGFNAPTAKVNRPQDFSAGLISKANNASAAPKINYGGNQQFAINNAGYQQIGIPKAAPAIFNVGAQQY